MGTTSKILANMTNQFVRDNLKECCAELDEWSNTGILRDGKVRELVRMLRKSLDEHGARMTARSTIEYMAVEAISRGEYIPAKAADELADATADLLRHIPEVVQHFVAHSPSNARSGRFSDDGFKAQTMLNLYRQTRKAAKRTRTITHRTSTDGPSARSVKAAAPSAPPK